MTIYHILTLVIPLALLIFLIWKKMDIVIAAPICSALMALMAGANVLEALKTAYMSSFGSYCQNYWLLFFLGAIYASIMKNTGAAADIANRIVHVFGTKYIILVVSMTALLMTMGGISAFVIIFVMFPIALQMMKAADLPKHLIIAYICFGAMGPPNFIPGYPATINLIPAEFFGTGASPVWLFSLTSVVLLFLYQYAYCVYVTNKARKNGEHFVVDQEMMAMLSTNKDETGSWLPLIPFGMIVIPLLLKVDPIIALTLGSVSAIIIYWKKLDDKMLFFNGGVKDGAHTIINVAAVAGIGGVMSLTPAYNAIIDMATNSSGSSPLVAFAVPTAIITLVTGSGTAAEAIVLNAIGQHFVSLGINPELLHHVVRSAAITFWAVPYGAVVCMILSFAKESYKTAYKHFFFLNLVGNVINCIYVVLVGTILYL